MNSISDYIEDLETEAPATRAILLRIPEVHLAWKPHEKSMTLGRLGMHVAELPAWIVSTLQTSGMDFAAGAYKPNIPDRLDQILTRFEEGIPAAAAALRSASDEALAETWSARAGDRIIWSLPKRTLVRQTLRHIVHHRGQLSVYLRMLNVPLPKMFGPTADERS